MTELEHHETVVLQPLPRSGGDYSQARALAVGAEWLLGFRAGIPRRTTADHIGYPLDPNTEPALPRDTSRIRGGLTWWRWCTLRGIDLMEANHRHVLAWLDALNQARKRDGQPYGQTTKGQMASAVSAFYDYARRAEVYPYGNPVDMIDRKKLGLTTNTKKSTTRSLSLDEIRALQECADWDQARGADATRSSVIVALLAGLALRVDEFCQLTTANVLWNHGNRVMSVTGKGLRQRALRLPPAVLTRLDDYQQKRATKALAVRGQPDAPIPLVCTSTGRPYSDVGVRSLLRRLAGCAGIPEPKTVTPHVLRHTWASMGREKGVHESVIQAWLGHASIETTRRYGVASDTAIDQAAEDVAAYMLGES